MSEVLSGLRRQAKQLRLLARDLAQPHADWSVIVDSTHILGARAPVDAWYLAEHFLRTWSNWHGLRARYGRYFATDTIASSPSWESDDRRYTELAQRLWSDANLQQLIAHSWRRDFGGDHAAAELGGGALFHGILSTHEAVLLVLSLSHSRPLITGSADQIALQCDNRLKAAFDRAAPETRHDLSWQLRNYRHATLQVSWLAGENDEHVPRVETCLDHALAEDRHAARLGETLIEPLLTALDDDQCCKVLRRVVRAVSEIGYEHFCDDVTSREMRGGDDSPLGAPDVQVIPDPGQAHSGAIVIALSRRGRRRASLVHMLEQTTELLEAAPGPPRAVIVVSDTWDAGIFATTALSSFREHHARGVQFAVLLVGSPEQIVSPVPVLLNGRSLDSGAEPVEVAIW